MSSTPLISLIVSKEVCLPQRARPTRGLAPCATRTARALVPGVVQDRHRQVHRRLPLRRGRLRPLGARLQRRRRGHRQGQVERLRQRKAPQVRGSLIYLILLNASGTPVED